MTSRICRRNKGKCSLMCKAAWCGHDRLDNFPSHLPLLLWLDFLDIGPYAIIEITKAHVNKISCDTSFYCHEMYCYIVATKHCCNTNLAIATIQFFVAICTNLLQRKRVLHTTKNIRCNIEVLLQPSTKELQYHLNIATPIKLPTTQIKSWQ